MKKDISKYDKKCCEHHCGTCHWTGICGTTCPYGCKKKDFVDITEINERNQMTLPLFADQTRDEEGARRFSGGLLEFTTQH